MWKISHSYSRNESLFTLEYFGLRSISTFWAQNKDKKMLKLIKILNYDKSSCISFCVIKSLYSQYILFTKRIETFWSRDVSSRWDIRYYGLWLQLFLFMCFAFYVYYCLLKMKGCLVSIQKILQSQCLRFNISLLQ